VLAAAEAEFSAVGLKASIEAIARRAGVGVGTVCRHFPTKEALVEAVLTAMYRSLLADAEAALGWVNWHATLRPRQPLSPAIVAGALSEQLDEALTAAGLSIVHVKVLDQAPTGYVRASICASGDEPVADGALDASPCARHDLIVNARALGDPVRLSRAVADCLDMLGGRVDLLTREAFRPSAPTPERRA